MQIQQLKLANFRNYRNLTISFSDHYNLIYGNNGMGKTNLIEAIYVLALTKSFRGTIDKVLIMNHQSCTKIEGELKQLVNNTYQIVISNEGKKVKINGNNIPKLSDYISKINVVLFNPDDLRIIKDTPSVRRKNINLDISELNNSYLKLLNNYNKILKQRNIYLKSMNINSNTDSDYLDVLTSKLIDLGLKIYKYRKEYLNSINEYLSDFYKKITGEETLKIKYISNFNNLSIKNIEKLYKDTLTKDIIFGKTHVGIHHDDFIFIKNDQNLKDFGSEGQQKNSIIAYKLVELEIFFKKKNDYPILILDDLVSELDNEKINNILKILNKNIQIFITTTDLKSVNKDILENSKKFLVEDGKVREVF